MLLVSEAISALVCSPIFGYALDISGTRQGPYLIGLGLLFASMAVLTGACSVAWYVTARVLQGAATAMVAVAGLAIVTDAVDKSSLGYMIGYIGTAMTLGFMSGPLLGGLVYHLGGYYAVFGMAFGIVAFDFLLRLVIIEKKAAVRWLMPANSERASDIDVFEQPLYGTISRHSSTRKVSSNTFALWKLLQQPCILASLWAVVVAALVVSAFDTVRPVSMIAFLSR